MVVCIGPTGCGKTSLLDKLTNPNYSLDQERVPTVGVNIFNLTLKKPINKQKIIQIRELGGALCPVLSSYLKTELNVVFVVDSANLGQVSQVGVLLTEILDLLEENGATQQRIPSLCLVFSKTDIGGADRIASIKNVIKLDSLIQYFKVRITITSSSTRTEETSAGLVEWLKKTASEHDISVQP